jgi:hypothetical protein
MTTVATELTDRLDRIEYAAAYDLWDAVPPEDCRHAGLICARRGGCRVVGSRLTPSTEMLNRILGATSADVEDGSLAWAIQLLQDHGCACQVPVGDDTADGHELRRWLWARGFVDGYAWMKFVRDAAEVVDDGPLPRVRVHRCTAADRQRFGAVIAAGFGLPAELAVAGAAVVGRNGWHCYLAETESGDPVAGGAMYVDGDLAWLGLGATVPAARRMGAQGVILRRRIADALRLGCALVVTETGERVEDRPSASYRNILRAGFAEYGLRRHMILPQPPGAARPGRRA